ncbi:MAG: 4-hydroxythreonine-4-phosphate dehydrogenase PdxA [Prevotella sp.]|nr:4-hydroxythreonine-4-phosphate dehydrogenase PdxA [Prevotella sp.]
MEDRKIRVAITHGDTNGIGYEVILRTFEAPEMLELCTPIIYGSPKVAAYHRKSMDLQTPFSIIANAGEAKDDRVNLLTTFDDEVKVEFGQPTQESAEAARKAMNRAKEDLQKGLFDVLVMAPVVPNPNPVKDEKALTVMLSSRVRIGLVTTHLPIKEVSQAITVEKIINKATIFQQSLRRDFRISNPRIAVLALNPQEGAEEKEVIIPAIAELEKKHVQAFGPYAADAFFGQGQYLYFDGVLAMYDDQGVVPFKTLAHEYGVKMKAGITAICTTPDHGPAFDIAGKGIADEQSMRQAIYTAIDMYRHRQDYDEPLADPLPKLFHEKREDGDKARFAIRAKDQFKKQDEK